MTTWLILALTAVLVGVGKTGFSGLSLIPVSIFASYFGKESVGVLLPLLVCADLTVYPAMIKHGSWREVWPLLPPALLGITVGMWLLHVMPESWARPVIGSFILLLLLVMLWKKVSPASPLHRSRAFGVVAAMAGGIATMLANAAGPIIKIYLLTKEFPKMELVGISARFFLLINLLKLPLLGGASLITRETLLLDLRLIPCVIAGVFVGKWLLQKVPQRLFDRLIIAFALIAAVRLFWFG